MQTPTKADSTKGSPPPKKRVQRGFRRLILPVSIVVGVITVGVSVKHDGPSFAIIEESIAKLGRLASLSTLISALNEITPDSTLSNLPLQPELTQILLPETQSELTQILICESPPEMTQKLLSETQLKFTQNSLSKT